MAVEYTPTDMMDREGRSNRYYRNAVERHWDPFEIDLTADLENMVAAARESHEEFEVAWEAFLSGVARFGAGEDAVTEDLAPLAVVLEDIDDQLYLTTQLYEEAKHADFFDRYWREVIWGVEEELGMPQSNPRDETWFSEDYRELFDRNRAAQYRLLENDTPENRASAYCHYHLTIEGILAQTGYYAMQHSFGGEYVDDGVPYLPGLVEGFDYIRSDEGRHVGFGMSQLKRLVQEEGIDPALIDETVAGLLPLLEGITEDEAYDPVELDDRIFEEGELFEYTITKHTERMRQITEDAAAIPEVSELVALDGVD